MTSVHKELSQIFKKKNLLIKKRKREKSLFLFSDCRQTPKFVHFLSHLKLYPILPYTVPHGVKGMFRKKDFVYDAYFDCYLCPNNQPLLP